MTDTYPLSIKVRYCPKENVNPPLNDANFSDFLSRLTMTHFTTYECTLETEVKGYSIYAKNRFSPVCWVEVTYTTPKVWKTSKDKGEVDDDKTLRDAFESYWPENQVCFSFKNEGDSKAFVSLAWTPLQPTSIDSMEDDKEEKTGPHQALYITLKTWKMAGPVISKDNLEKIAGKITSAVTHHCLPYDVIFQAKQDDGFCKLLVKNARKVTPVVQAMLEFDQGCQIEASFDKEVHGILDEFFPSSRFYVHVTRK